LDLLSTIVGRHETEWPKPPAKNSDSFSIESGNAIPSTAQFQPNTRAVDDSLVRRYVFVGDKMCLSHASMCSEISWVKITYETRQT